MENKLTHEEIVSFEKNEDKLTGGEYKVFDISSEEYRTIIFPGLDAEYRIDHPVTLIIRKGGTTHRVVDENGEVHCYLDPSLGLTVIKWKSKEGEAPVAF